MGLGSLLALFKSPKRDFRCHFDVFVTSANEPPVSPELRSLVEGHVTWERVERGQSPDAFEPPTAAYALGLVESSAESVAKVADALAGATICFRVRATKQAQDLTPLQAAMGLCAGLLQTGGVAVVDRTSGIGYSAKDFDYVAATLNEQGALDALATIVIDVSSSGAATQLRTRGMSKFGVLDFVVPDLAAEHVQLGRMLLENNVVPASALRAPILPGQTLQYSRTDPAAKLFFTATNDGALVVSDCHPTEKRAVAGITKFISVATEMTAARDKARAAALEKMKAARGE